MQSRGTAAGGGASNLGYLFGESKYTEQPTLSQDTTQAAGLRSDRVDRNGAPAPPVTNHATDDQPVPAYSRPSFGRNTPHSSG